MSGPEGMFSRGYGELDGLTWEMKWARSNRHKFNHIFHLVDYFFSFFLSGRAWGFRLSRGNEPQANTVMSTHTQIYLQGAAIYRSKFAGQRSLTEPIANGLKRAIFGRL